ncbi:Increased DNA methylation 1 [Senna tora]|uniref:Increased DNA methylation 1 n=1 Tax=Senna tora TaxID=362788 RepID=A0A834SPT0_9FABA|nr:Increased DNA methylation 1 [Senna tora]
MRLPSSPPASKVPAEDLEPWKISIPKADEVVVESEYCPQAVMDWYEYTGGVRYRSKGKKSNCLWRESSLKAKKHLRALGWTLWYANKKGKQELRYKSPHNGKNFYSLRMACKACMEDGGCRAESVSSNHQPFINPLLDHNMTPPLKSLEENEEDSTMSSNTKMCSRTVHFVIEWCTMSREYCDDTITGRVTTGRTT